MPDNLTPEQRRYCMSRNKGKDTELELRVRSELHKRGLRYRKHVKELPGKPDIVFTKAKVAVFIDGDFWHGYRFSRWEHNLTPFWRNKISSTRERDRRNFRKLRHMGWKVIRIWEHDVEKDIQKVINRIIYTINNTPKYLKKNTQLSSDLIVADSDSIIINYKP